MKITHEIQAVSNPLADNFKEIKSLEERTGFLTKLGVKRKIGQAAGKALTRIEELRVEGEVALAETGIKLAVVALQAAMVANAMPQIGILTTRLNSNTAAVNQSLTNGGIGEIASHMRNRSANKKLFSDLVNEGKILPEEQEVLSNFAEDDAATDILRTRHRTEEATKAVDALHACALSGITSTQDILKGNR